MLHRYRHAGPPRRPARTVPAFVELKRQPAAVTVVAQTPPPLCVAEVETKVESSSTTAVPYNAPPSCAERVARTRTDGSSGHLSAARKQNQQRNSDDAVGGGTSWAGAGQDGARRTWARVAVKVVFITLKADPKTPPPKSSELVCSKTHAAISVLLPEPNTAPPRSPEEALLKMLPRTTRSGLLELRSLQEQIAPPIRSAVVSSKTVFETRTCEGVRIDLRTPTHSNLWERRLVASSLLSAQSLCPHR